MYVKAPIPSEVYHLTKKANLESILDDGAIRRFDDTECWFCESLAKMKAYMEQTVLCEGKPYYGVGGQLCRYPKFEPDEHIILKLTPSRREGYWYRWNQVIPLNSPPELVQVAAEFSKLKIGFRGDLPFRNAEAIDVAEFLHGSIVCRNVQTTSELWKRLSEKVEQNWQTYQRNPYDRSPGVLIGIADEIAATATCYSEFLCSGSDLSRRDLSYLLQFENPLDVLRDRWVLDQSTEQGTRFLGMLESLRSEGHAVIIITHKLDEVLAVSDRVTVLHKGKSVATVNTAETDEYALTSLMVGHAVDLNIQRAEASVGSELLDVHALNVFRADGSQALKDVSFTLSAGEILGVAGVAGSGQKELCESIAGLHPIAGGSILMENKRIDGLTPREIINRGVSMSFIPEDRLGMGLAGGLSLYDNLLLKTYRDQKGVFLRRRQAKDEAVQMVKELEISTPSISTQVRKLSGGNVQKVLLGRELNANPRVLITAYPVRGLDINSSMTIYHLLNEQKKKGVGVLFIGEDLDVLLSLCDRILVLCNGRVSAIVNSKYATKELLGLKMTGAWEHDDEEDDYA